MNIVSSSAEASSTTSPTALPTIGGHPPPTANDVSTNEEPMVKQLKPPPIFVSGVTNYIIFAQFLVEKQVEDCQCKETNSEFILNIISYTLSSAQNAPIVYMQETLGPSKCTLTNLKIRRYLLCTFVGFLVR